jgi:hypothetical protein
VEEQSHKDEMRAALRGDFERMRRRLTQGESEVDEPLRPEIPDARASQDGGSEGATGSWLERLLGRA